MVQTYANIAANIAQAQQTIGAAAGWHGTTMDWLPWNHVSGAFGKMLTLVAGGTLYIDEGKPVPGPMWQESLRNLREVPGSYYVNVPLGYQLLVEALEADEDLRRTFFRDLKVLLYGGAGLPQPIYERLQRLAVSTIGQRHHADLRVRLDGDDVGLSRHSLRDRQGRPGTADARHPREARAGRHSLRGAHRRSGRDAVLPARSATHGRESRRGRLLPHGRSRGVSRSRSGPNKG